MSAVSVQALRAKLAEQATGVADTSCSPTGLPGVTRHVKRHQVVPSRTKTLMSGTFGVPDDCHREGLVL